MDGRLLSSLRLDRSTIGRDGIALVGGVACTSGRPRPQCSGVTALGRFHRNALTVDAGHHVVGTGPYRHVRYPLHSATILAFWSGSG